MLWILKLEKLKQQNEYMNSWKSMGIEPPVSPCVLLEIKIGLYMALNYCLRGLYYTKSEDPFQISIKPSLEVSWGQEPFLVHLWVFNGISCKT